MDFQIEDLTTITIDDIPSGAIGKEARGFRVPIVLLQWPGNFVSRHSSLGDKLYVPLMMSMKQAPGKPQTDSPTTRAVHLSKLSAVLRNGVDVEPTDSIIFVDDPSKSLEYGQEGTGRGADADQLLMVFRWKALRRAVYTVNAEKTSEDLGKLRAMYPTELLDGNWRVFTRATEEQCRRGGGYLNDYGVFIPGDPWNALQLLVLIGDDLRRLGGSLRSAASSVRLNS